MTDYIFLNKKNLPTFLGVGRGAIIYISQLLIQSH